MTILDRTRSGDPILDEELVKDYLDEIARVGYTPSDDEAALARALDDGVYYILERTNQRAVPAPLRSYVIELAMGKYLLARIKGREIPKDFDFPRAVKTLKEGGDEITFADNSSDEDRFTAYVEYYAKGGDGRWLYYRRINWM